MRGLARLGLCAWLGCSYNHGTIIDASPGGDVPRDIPGDTPSGDMNPDMTIQGGCPLTYTLHDAARPNSFYRSITASVSWSVAEEICESDRLGLATHLIVLDDENERIWAFAQNTSDQWVGMTDAAASGIWVAVTVQPNPYVGQASGNLPSKNCLILKQSETAADGCTNGHPYLCECDMFALQL